MSKTQVKTKRTAYSTLRCTITGTASFHQHNYANICYFQTKIFKRIAEIVPRKIRLKYFATFSFTSKYLG